jgi:hypothetical protein
MVYLGGKTRTSRNAFWLIAWEFVVRRITLALSLIVQFSVVGAPPKDIPNWSALPKFTGPFGNRMNELVARPLLKTATKPERMIASPQLVDWLLDHPDWSAQLWSDAGLRVGRVERLEDGWRSHDFDGSWVEFHLVHREQGIRCYYCRLRGAGMLGAMRGDAVVVYRSAHLQLGDRWVPWHAAEVYAAADGPATGMILKVAKNPAEKAAAQTLRETLLYFSLLGRLLELRFDWAEPAIARCSQVLPPIEGEQLLGALRQRRSAN